MCPKIWKTCIGECSAVEPQNFRNAGRALKHNLLQRYRSGLMHIWNDAFPQIQKANPSLCGWVGPKLVKGRAKDIVLSFTSLSLSPGSTARPHTLYSNSHRRHTFTSLSQETLSLLAIESLCRWWASCGVDSKLALAESTECGADCDLRDQLSFCQHIKSRFLPKYIEGVDSSLASFHTDF